ncbi:hypothetical protein SLS58_000409 [Diplodia intermedia]|uniref:Uncharacterized protein n=1 Tax=Diplodia intermedia TaxID=856260 RepID=A0ABR3U6Q6_9PEZI
MEPDFGMPNAYHPAGPVSQRAPQPFAPPNGYANLGQIPVAPPSPGPATSARIIPASLLHGPYAAGYYTYTPGPQPQYQYHPAYNHTSPGYPRQYQRTTMAPYPMMIYSATGSPPCPQASYPSFDGFPGASFNPNLTTEDSTPRPAFNNLMPMHNHSEKNNPESANHGPSQLRDMSHGPADTGSPAGKHPFKQPKVTFKEAFMTNDTIKKKVDKHTHGLSKDEDASKAIEKPLEFDEDAREMFKNVDAMNESMKSVRLDAMPGRNRVKQGMRSKPPQGKDTPLSYCMKEVLVADDYSAANPKKLVHSKDLSEETIPNLTATNHKDGPWKPNFQPITFASGDTAHSHSHGGMFPRTYKRSAASAKVVDAVPVFFDSPEEINLGSSSDHSGSVGVATPQESLGHELEDQFFDMFDKLSHLRVVWLTGTPEERAAISAKAEEMMQIGHSARGDTSGKKGTAEGK